MKKCGTALLGSLFVALALLPLFVACRPSGIAASTGSIAISLSADAKSRTLDPGSAGVVCSYDVTIARSGSSDAYSFSLDLASASNYVQEDLVAGAWTVTAIGKNAGGAKIVWASEEVNVRAGLTSKLTLTCSPNAEKLGKNGTLSLGLKWPTALVSNPSIQATLIPTTAVSEERTLHFTVDAANTDATLTAKIGSLADIASGYYTLLLLLQTKATENSNPITVWGHVEAVQILSNAQTTGNWTLSSSSLVLGGISISITSCLNSPITVTLSETVQGANMIVTASASVDGASYAPTSWQWYLNGAPISDATSAAVTIDTSAMSGPYWLDVVAIGEERSGSAGCQFTVD
jgi:hypothetical protein